MARAWAIEQYGEDAYTRELTVVTTIDSRKQRAATTALRKALLAYDERHGWRGPEAKLPAAALTDAGHDDLARSEERRVGKECVSTCRSRWSPYHSKKKYERHHELEKESAMGKDRTQGKTCRL